MPLLTGAVTQHGLHGGSSQPYGSTAGKAPAGGKTFSAQFTQHGPHGAASLLYGSFAGKVAGTAPTITAVDPVSGTELSVSWTGTASRYRLDGGTPVALVDTVSPATISGLTPDTEYTVELDNGDGIWSNAVAEFTDNTGSGGGPLPQEMTAEACAQAATSSQAAIAQAHNVAAAACAQAGVSSAAAIGQVHILVGSSCSQAGASGTGIIGLNGAISLAGADCAQAAASGAGGITIGDLSSLIVATWRVPAETRTYPLPAEARTWRANA